MQQNHEVRRVGGVVTQRIANPLPIFAQDAENKAQQAKLLWEKPPGQTQNRQGKPKTLGASPAGPTNTPHSAHEKQARPVPRFDAVGHMALIGGVV